MSIKSTFSDSKSSNFNFPKLMMHKEQEFLLLATHISNGNICGFVVAGEAVIGGKPAHPSMHINCKPDELEEFTGKVALENER